MCVQPHARTHVCINQSFVGYCTGKDNAHSGNYVKDLKEKYFDFTDWGKLISVSGFYKRRNLVMTDTLLKQMSVNGIYENI